MPDEARSSRSPAHGRLDGRPRARGNPEHSKAELCTRVIVEQSDSERDRANGSKRLLIMWCGLLRVSFSFHRQSFAVALAVVAAACSESAVSQTTGPDPLTRCQTAVTGLPTSLAPSAARLTATVSTNRECQWTIQSEASWVRVTPDSGQGEASVSIVVAKTRPRSIESGVLVVNGSRVAVSQQAAVCRFELANSSSRVPPEGGPFSVSVSTIPGCKWSASSEVSWVRVVSAELTGSDNVAFVADANTGGERSGTLKSRVRPSSLSRRRRHRVPRPTHRRRRRLPRPTHRQRRRLPRPTRRRRHRLPRRTHRRRRRRRRR